MKLMASPLPNRFRRRLAQLKADKRGIAATEFALLLPVMLVLFVAVGEVGEAISISRKVTIAARTIPDLVTQYAALSTTDMNSLLGAAAQVMTPYNSSNVTVIVSEITTDSSSNATFDWSAAYNGTAYTAGQAIPAQLKQKLQLPASVSVVLGQVQYRYTPVFGYNIIGTTVLSDQIYLNPRLCIKIAYGASTTTSTNTSSCAAYTAVSSSSSSSSSSGSGSTSSGTTSSGSTSGTSGTSSGTSGSSGGSSGSSGGTCSWWSWWC